MDTLKTGKHQTLFNKLNPDCTNSKVLFNKLNPDCTNSKVLFNKLNPDCTNSKVLFNKLNPDCTNSKVLFNKLNPDCTNSKVLINLAIFLSIMTIVYNIGEGIISTLFGYSDETISLFGFGVDSFVEVLSGAGVFHMLLRLKKSGEEKRAKFERQALFITGIGFFLLTAGLVIGGCITLVIQHKPETTLVGIIVAIVSIASMWILMMAKLKTGRKLDSAAIIADAHCTKTCFYLSFILLAASLIYELFTIPFVDAIGGLGIAFFAFREGWEAIEKARSDKTCCCESGPKCPG